MRRPEDDLLERLVGHRPPRRMSRTLALMMRCSSRASVLIRPFLGSARYSNGRPKYVSAHRASRYTLKSADVLSPYDLLATSRFSSGQL